MTSTYAWIITKDHLAEPGAGPGSLAENAATVAGPRDAPEEMLARLRAGDGEPFRLYDDDEELYYDGLFLGDSESEDGFGPLDDFGTPNAGATEIRYRRAGGKWETL
jgi:hypothetical protein